MTGALCGISRLTQPPCRAGTADEQERKPGRGREGKCIERSEAGSRDRNGRGETLGQIPDLGISRPAAEASRDKPANKE
jgi:hypothetical protein